MYFSDEKGNQFEKLTPRGEVFSLNMNQRRPWREKFSFDFNVEVLRASPRVILYWLPKI